jgi:hypothetical protein
MALPAFKETFEAIQEAPPRVDWEAALAFVQDLDDFQKAVTAIERSMAEWRARMHERLSTGLAKLEKLAAPLPNELVNDELLPFMDPTLEALHEGIKTYSVPFHEQWPPLVAARISELGGAPGKFLRKQIKRAEDVRVKQYNAYVDFYYTLLAFNDKYALHEPASADAFDNGTDLAAFLRESRKAG